MNRRLIVCALSLAVTLAAVGVRAQSGTPGDCPNDSKLLNGGPTSVYGTGPGSWWDLVIGGLNAAGLTNPADQLAYLDQVFGMQFASLDDARQFNLDVLSATYDKNGNGYVCAFELRGTRAYSGDPLINTTTFGVGDDKLSNK